MTGGGTTGRGKKGREAELARERLATVGFIASLVSHPARNRLASLRAALELLNAGLERSFSQEYRETLLQEFDAFVGDFNLGVDMVRTDGGRVEGAAALAILEEAVDTFRPQAARRGIRVDASFERTPAGMVADRHLLRVSVLNLLRNSAEALDGVFDPRIDIRTGSEKKHLWVEVDDNGPGVPAGVRDRIFEVAGAGQERSMGLGLRICRDAMTVLGGSIRLLLPEGGRGARFRLEVPLD